MADSTTIIWCKFAGVGTLATEAVTECRQKSGQKRSERTISKKIVSYRYKGFA